MESEGTLPHSQVPATWPCPGTDHSVPCPQRYFLNIYFNTVLPSTPRSSNWSLSSGFHQKSGMLLSSPYMCYMPHPPNYSWFFQPNNNGQVVQIWRSSLRSLSHSAVTSIFLSPNIFHCLCFYLNMRDQVSYTHKTSGKLEFCIF